MRCVQCPAPSWRLHHVMCFNWTTVHLKHFHNDLRLQVLLLSFAVFWQSDAHTHTYTHTDHWLNSEGRLKMDEAPSKDYIVMETEISKPARTAEETEHNMTTQKTITSRITGNYLEETISIVLLFQDLSQMEFIYDRNDYSVFIQMILYI